MHGVLTSRALERVGSGSFRVGRKRRETVGIGDPKN